MCFKLFPRQHRRYESGGFRFSAPATALLSVTLSFFILLGGCSNREAKKKSTPISGSLLVYVTPAMQPVVQVGADHFNRLYSQANVIVLALDSRSIVDSMIQGKTDAAYFDRSLSPAESLAIAQSRRHVYSFLLGTTVATWLVHPDNLVSTLDSTQLLNVLSGKIKSWQDLGGADELIHIYLPSLGDGAWESLVEYFGSALQKVEAHYWPSDSLVLANVKDDPDALGLIGKQITPGPEVKKIKWINPILADPVPANIGTLQEGKYPFQIRLYYYTIADRTDLASGFLSFLVSNSGQRLIADHGFLPAMVPVRIVNLSGGGDQK